MGLFLFCLYGFLLLVLGVHDAVLSRRGPGAADAYYVNGRASGAGQVALSVVASCVGGSATIGMAGLAWQIGLPAFWWLGSGACGLIVLVRFLAAKVRESGARTMPELVGAYLGGACRPLVSVIILLAWTAILAAQFTAMSGLTVALTGLSPELALPLGAALITAYSVLGGQASVIRSDAVQYLLLAAGFVAVLLFLLVSNPRAYDSVAWVLLSPDFPPASLVRYLFILGGSYLVCPMLFGRFLSARDARCATMGGRLAVGGLVLTGLLIVLVGIGCRGLIPPGTTPDQALPALLGALPPWLGLTFLLALVSAVLSSADSCLLTAATVCGNDLLRRDSVASCRTAALAIAAVAYFLSSQGKGILSLLFMANDIYVCGVVVPVFMGMLGGRACLAPGWAFAAVLAGGALGLASAMTGENAWAYAGLAVSALLSLCGMFLGRSAVAFFR